MIKGRSYLYKIICASLLFYSFEAVYADSLEDFRSGNYNQAAKEINNDAKDAQALFYLGKMRLYGYGQLKNTPNAIRAFSQAGDKGYLPAQQFMARYSLIHENNLSDALYWFKKAANQNDLEAQLYCAAAYRFGLGVKKNVDLARRYYIDAAKNGNSIAQYSLAEEFLNSKQNKKLGLLWLDKAVAQKNPAAEILLAEVDPTQANQLLTSAISKNYAPALVKMGDLALKENNYEKAKEWYTKAVDAKYYPAALKLSHLYSDDKSPIKNPETAFLWMLKAAQAGNREAQIEVANYYKNGIGVTADAAQAEEWKQKATKTTDVQLAEEGAAFWLSDGKINNLQTLYPLKGILTAWENKDALKENNYNPTPQTEVISKESLFKPNFAVAKPNDIPINEFFDAIVTSLQTAKQEDLSFPRYPLDPQISNPETAQKMFKTLENRAVLGDPTAQFVLAQMYQKGLGTKKDINQAIKFYELGAGQQDLKAEYNLGLIYLEGEDISPDFEKGIGLLRGAAFKGNDYAQYVLALIDEKGYRNANGETIYKPDLDSARAMFALAADNDYGPAQYRLAGLMAQQKSLSMSVPDQLKRTNTIKNLYERAVKAGVEQARLPLAFFNTMDKDVKKQVEAFQVAEKEADEGNTSAALLLGLFYDRGIYVTQDQTKAIYWYEKAAKNPISAFILGTYYSQGELVSKDLPKASELLQQAANAGFSYANLNLAIIKKELNEPFLPELEKAISQGNSTAGLLLADYYLSQANDNEKMQGAKEIYQRFADKGDAGAQVKYGYMLEVGLGGNSDINNAAEQYKKAAEQGHAVGQYLLGHLNQIGKLGKEPDYAEAKKWYSAASSKNTLAAINLGFINETVYEDYNAAKDSYKLAAQDNPIAFYNLGLIYEKGKGEKVDFDKAKEYYQQAADKGHIQSMSQLAGIYFGLKDESKALNWYKKAAELGERDALYQLGLLSETGVALDLDLTQAHNYYQQAAAKGNAKAILALARMYQYGLGVSQDLVKATDYYQELAKQDNAYAQYQLATFLYEGVNGKKDPSQAKSLLLKAQANGSTQARRVLQWIDSQAQERLSYIDPVTVKEAVVAEQPVNLMYLDALNDWNRGDESSSRLLLDQIMKQFPNYTPAKRAYEQIKQMPSSIFG